MGTIETTITIGSSEVPATVEYFIERGDPSVGYSGGVVVEKITLGNMPGTKSHLKHIPIEITGGLLFDAMADDWLCEKCLEHAREDA